MQNEGFRLSPEQRRFWLLQQTGPAHRAQCAVMVEGALRPERLRQAVQQVVDRHEILHTTFPVPPGMKVPYQVVSDRSSISWQGIDLTSLLPEEQETQVDSLFEEQKRVPFDFEHGPLLQLCLIKFSAKRHVLLVCLPSLCADAVTLRNLIREIGQWYSALEPDQNVRSEPLQYADFSAWHEELLQKTDEEASSGKQYWRKRGLPSIPPLVLPFARDGKAPASFAPACFSLQLNRDLTARLNQTAGACAVSVFTLVLACWQTLLWRLTRQSDVVVGTVFDGRKLDELRGALGLFAKTLPVHCRLEEESKFSEIAARVDGALRDACDRQEYFLAENAVDAAALPIAFEFDAPWPKCETAEAAVFIYRQYTCTDRFTVKLRCFDRGDCLGAEFHYDPDKVVAQDIERLAQQFHTVLTDAVDNPQSRIDELQILSDLERKRVVAEWNDTRTHYSHYSKDKCVHHLFEQQAERQRTRTALIYEEQQLTYAELNARSNQLAHYLQSLGVRLETPVGICVERSLEMIVGLLGVLKAGGAYVPLDPLLPKERLKFVMEDTQVPVLLSQQRLVDNLPEHKARVVCLDRDWNMVASQSEENITSEVTSKNLAYLLFTSGSTGKPKGVMVEHRQLLSYLHGILSRLDLPAGASFATVSTFAADLGNTAIFPALCTGGCLHVVSLERASEPAALADYFARHPIDCLKIVPSHLEALLSSSCPEQVLPHKRLVLGGEASGLKLIEKLEELAPGCTILNHYGPTETTVGVATYRADNGQSDHCSLTVPIGRPISNTQIYILDSYLRPVPIWMPGELYIGGDNVTRGYLNRPELTAEKFIPNPFGVESNARLYKTGDFGRYLPDGNIEFLGRIDDQIKVRGFRVELGEIEAALGQHPAVRQAVIVLREDANDKRLVAYVCLEENQPAPASELRLFLKSKLPDYMLPSAFVMLDRLPLTQNGKLDRRALPAPDQSRSDQSSYVAPGNLVEELLAGIWAEVLKLKAIGIQDNFFNLGGHSLLATRLISRIRDAFRLDLPLRSLFEAPTVAGMAKRIEEADCEEQRLSPRPILPVSRDQALPLSFSQQRLWFLDQYEPNSSVYNIPSALRLRGSLDIRALEQSLNEIRRRHESLRTTCSMVDGEAVQVIAPSVEFSLAVVDLRDHPEGEREEEARRLAKDEARRHFDLAQGPLFRSKLLRLGEDDHVLLLTMHHIVSDGWSTGVLYRELSMLYRAFLNGESSPLPELPIQCADYAVWQREWLQGEVLHRQLSYWTKQLEGIPAVLNLPTDHPRPAVQSYRGARQSIEVSKELSQGLKALSRKEGVTLFMTLLAAFQTLLHRYSGQDDIVIGSPIANRNRPEIEGLIGFFVNTLVLRSNFSDNPTFKELLGRVREMTLGAYAYQDLPFEKLVEELQPERSLSHSPLFQVMFVLQNVPSTALTVEGLSASSVRIEAETAKFELTLSVREEGEGLKGALEYSVALFEPATITRMASHFHTLVQAIVSNPDQRISDLPILSEAEKRQLLIKWNDTKTVYPKDKCIHQLFEEQVEKTPGATAVVFEGQRLTYEELNIRANQLAHYLRKFGVGPETLVGISVERSLEMIVGLLGILKAGGAYVPLDPQYPKERLAFMLEDTQVRILLTQELMVGRLPDHVTRVICLDRDWEQIARERDDNPIIKTERENLIYVIYTSGSTGKPKGVMVHQLGLSNVIQTQIRVFGVQPNSRVLQFASLNFDASISEIMMALCAGATLCLGRKEDLLPGEPLVQFLLERAITHCTLPPSAMAALPSRPLPLLSTVTVAGEICSAEVVARWAPGRRFLNLYGPTEASIWTTGVEWAQNGHAPPIGKPIANTKIYILDTNLHPVPVGVLGELYIGGIGLARGYLRRPDLTAEKFIPDPFSAEPGGRLYKTGDRARYRMDGNVDFIGRTDHQVKVRGFRIEPAEIEAVLVEHPTVREAAVVATADNYDANQLVAFVVLNEKLERVASQLRSFLSEKLPNYMIPSDFSALEALPLTPNGKVDRLALTLRDHSNGHRETTYVPPQTEIECSIASIWKELLRKDKIGLDDNFFDLGGHSLLLARLHSKLCHDLKKGLSIVDLFKYPTVRSLSNFLILSDAPRVSFQRAHERAQRQKESRNRQEQLRNRRA